MTQASLTFRLNSTEREAFLKLCQSNGVTPSLVLREYVRSALSKKDLPIGRKPWYEVPETKAAIAELKNGGGRSFNTVAELMKDLYEDD